MPLTTSKKLPCSISLQKLKRQFLKEMIINALYAEKGGLIVLKSMQIM